MSNYWEDKFDSGGFVGGVIGTGEFKDGDLSPWRVVQYLSYAVVVSDTDFAAWVQANDFEDRSELSPIRWNDEFRTLPRYQCYLASSRGDQIVTRLTLEEVRVFHALRVPFDESMKSLGFGQPSFDSLLSMIARALNRNHNLTFEIANSVTCPLARKGFQDGEIDYLLDVDRSGREVVTVELSWLYKIAVDVNTGRLSQIIAAGG